MSPKALAILSTYLEIKQNTLQVQEKQEVKQDMQSVKSACMAPNTHGAYILDRQ